MATENMSNMDISYPIWSKVLLNDSKELRKKQSKDSAGTYSRRLFSKLNHSSSTPKKRSKPTFYQRYQKARKGSSSKKTATKESKQNIGSEWKKEYDVWNMIVQALDQSLLKNHKVNWPKKVIGIRDSNDKIRLIQNREELQQQILVASTGLKSRLKDLLNANDSTSDISLKMKFKLVPVVESLTIVNKSTETSYMFAVGDNEINNNDMQCENNEIENEPIENELEENQTLIDFVNNHESTGNITCDKTLVNTTCSTWEYSDFYDGIVPAASSTFVSDEKENIPCLMHEKENIPHLIAPKSKPSLDSKTFFDSPIPCFAKKKKPIQDDFQPGLHDLQQIMEYCRNARSTLQVLYDKVNMIEDRYISWCRQRSNLNFSMSGIDFLSDSIEL
ncbi:uncharacterized protein LOC129569985 [Sitodiplosis mosellana]|uniref:uncharacterized protein LOC129569985 n=1 Tax=Sitodiplosis mosellana TaxID=263140 RepID=UPI002443E169|nr:uncharacterized protein LOC129569985 [Sitodiplosis mosellana]